MNSIQKRIPQRLKYLLKNVNINFFHTDTDFLLHNIFILYFFFIVSLIYVFYLAFQKDIFSVTIFLLIGFLTSFFSKNMIVIFFISLTFTHIFKLSSTSKYSLEGFTGDTDEDAENKDSIEPPIGGDNNEDIDETTYIKKNDEKKKKNAATQQESMIADPEELDTDSNIQTSNNKTKNKVKGVSGMNDEGLEKIQEQTKILLDTHNELIQNIESLKPYLKQANDFTKSISKIMNTNESFSNYQNI